MKDKPQIGRKISAKSTWSRIEEHSQNSIIRKQQQIGKKWAKSSE